MRPPPEVAECREPDIGPANPTTARLAPAILLVALFAAVSVTVLVQLWAADGWPRNHEGDSFADFVGPLGMPTEIDGPRAWAVPLAAR